MKKKTATSKKKSNEPTNTTTPSKRVLVLKVLPPNGRSTNDFLWPKSGPVEALDWEATRACGNGLHGWLEGEGKVYGNLPPCIDRLDGGILHPETHWLVVSVDPSPENMVDFGGKVKFRRGEVVHYGDRKSATEYLAANGCSGKAIIGAISCDSSKNTGGYGSKNTGGNRSTNTGGDSSTNTGGYWSTNTGGYWSTNTGGDSSKNTGGDWSTNTGGDWSKNTGGYWSTNTGGDWSTNTGGDWSTNTGGDSSKNTGGDSSKNTGGDSSKNTGGYGSICSAGEGGIIQIRWRDNKAQRDRIATGYVGEDGIEPGVPYKLDAEGKFVRAEAAK